MDRKSIFTGFLLIAIGFILLADNFDLIRVDWEDFFEDFFQLWPLVMIAAGLGFGLAWFRNREQVGQLMPTMILLTYGCLFLYLSVSGDWWHMGRYNLWAFFIAGPGLGLLAMYLLGDRERGNLIGALILLGISALFLTGFDNLRLFWPALLILIGIRLLLKNRSNDKDISTASE